ncbi:MAG TPA: NAD(P)/FAD-dependent oxidoreductase [Burkholderiaceae bacterium]|jgi:protoporphyrinogen oxidase|nr:NAD(P)/FAD-dependent oxidoreductase [Burkholderiaceae bacterium]
MSANLTADTVIIGAGPAGLTTGLELVRAGRKDVLVLEASGDLGGISRTINFKGNRIDIGGHRFFSKSDWVMNWWRQLMPVAMPPDAHSESEFRLSYQGATRLLGAEHIHATESDETVMLLRNRLSRIYFNSNFFSYPLKPGIDMVGKLGVGKCAQFAVSYARAHAAPVTPERSLEDFFINRFGRALYLQFFKAYTEKVWGVPCSEISADWGAQRVKSLDVGKMITHALRKLVPGSGGGETQTSLIEHFLYPKFGPGQMWETAARHFEAGGGRIVKHAKVTNIERDGDRVTAVTAQVDGGDALRVQGSHFVSTMAIKDLVTAMQADAPAAMAEIGTRLQYRDFITVGVLYRKLRRTAEAIDDRSFLVADNWIYIQDAGVKVGRLQIFNNWSPYLVADPATVWVGLEFFARDDDELWNLSDDKLRALALREMQQLRLADEADAIDAVVIRQPKAYPGYFGDAYERFDELRGWLDGVRNLYLIGRNGMHRYNNQDHSMLSARYAVEAILADNPDKTKIWGVNIDDDYHEQEK